MDVTILYLTANLEQPYFAENIRQNILKHKGDIPIVSVSQKPLDFGKNICVGVQEPCYFSVIRQIQIGLNEINTKYVLNTDDDFLYPPDYFNFIPPESGHCYRYDNVWVCYCLHFDYPKPRFHFKGYVGGAQIVDREYYLSRINAALKGRKKWESGNPGHEYSMQTDHRYTWTGQPAIDFKTKHNISKGTSVQKKVWPRRSLPYWGNIKDLRKEMFE